MTAQAGITVGAFLRYIAAFAESAHRTKALEQEIQIGTGFHGKWYRSQKEHWLGYLGFRLKREAAVGGDWSAVSAGRQWSRLHCFPMLFWVAECAGVDDVTLTRAEATARTAAAAVGVDHPSHGKAARQVMPWSLVEKAILKNAFQASEAETAREIDAAYSRLSMLRPEFQVEGALN